MSDGEWVTLGAHEVDDLEAVVHHLRATFPESTIGLWGRSMGAVTALMYSQRDPSIAGVVSLSSPRPYPPPSPRKGSTIGLWQRSMGAVTTLIYSQGNPSIAMVVELFSTPSPSALFTPQSSPPSIGGKRQSNRDHHQCGDAQCALPGISCQPPPLLQFFYRHPSKCIHPPVRK